MEMIPEEYKKISEEEMRPQAYQLGKIDKNRGIIDEMRKDRAVQKKIMIITAVSAVVAVLAAVFNFVFQ